MEPDHVVGEVGVGTHAGGQPEQEVGERAHGDGAGHGGHRRGHDQVALGAGQALLGPRVRVRPGRALRPGRCRRVHYRRAVLRCARPAGVGEDRRVDGDDVDHGEERGGAGAELLGEGALAGVQLEIPPHPARRDGGLRLQEPVPWRQPLGRRHFLAVFFDLRLEIWGVPELIAQVSGEG